MLSVLFLMTELSVEVTLFPSGDSGAIETRFCLIFIIAVLVEQSARCVVNCLKHFMSRLSPPTSTSHYSDYYHFVLKISVYIHQARRASQRFLSKLFDKIFAQKLQF